jgi:hypothetical protein
MPASLNLLNAPELRRILLPGGSPVLPDVWKLSPVPMSQGISSLTVDVAPVALRNGYLEDA